VNEQVLVLPRETIPGGCDFTGIRGADVADLVSLRAAVATSGFFMDRAAAEQDSRFKQLIPYVLVRDGEQVFLMRRTDAGGDPRLHGRASIGVGGHVNQIDGSHDPLGDGLAREWSEELTADWQPEFRLIGFLNDESNAVGAVHLGIVFEVEAAGRAVAVRETDKLVGQFASTREVRDAWDRMETWSQLVVSHLLGEPVAG